MRPPQPGQHRTMIVTVTRLQHRCLRRGRHARINNELHPHTCIHEFVLTRLNRTPRRLKPLLLANEMHIPPLSLRNGQVISINHKDNYTPAATWHPRMGASSSSSGGGMPVALHLLKAKRSEFNTAKAAAAAQAGLIDFDMQRSAICALNRTDVRSRCSRFYEAKRLSWNVRCELQCSLHFSCTQQLHARFMH